MYRFGTQSVVCRETKRRKRRVCPADARTSMETVAWSGELRAASFNKHLPSPKDLQYNHATLVQEHSALSYCNAVKIFFRGIRSTTRDAIVSVFFRGRRTKPGHFNRSAWAADVQYCRLSPPAAIYSSSICCSILIQQRIVHRGHQSTTELYY